MEHVVYYFSGTGNSLRAAKEIEKLGAKVKSIAAEMNRDHESDCIRCAADQVGFVFPMYYLGLPKVVAEFIHKLDITKASYVYMICTMGWTLKGGAIHQMRRLLAEKDTTLNMGCYLHMPMNDFTYATVCKPEKQKIILDKFQTNMDKILKRVEQSECHFDREPINFAAKGSNTPFVTRVSKLDQKFYVTEDCIGCGLCEEVCSVGNIMLKDNKPVWKHKCQSCFSCFHYCPKHAILYQGKENTPQYHHPEITASDLKHYAKLY